MNSFNINTDAVVKFTNTLEKMHRSAFPNAVRGTLNKAAFDVKQNTMPESADDSFTIRQRNFFRASSRVEMAQGWNVKTMKSTVGFRSLRSGSFAVDNLEKQEYGGTVKKRAFIPTDKARGGNKSKLVRPSNRLTKIRNVVNPANIAGRNKQERFIRAAIKTGKGGYVLSNRNPRMLLKVTSVKRLGRNTVVRTEALYSYEKNRSVRVSETGFMRDATKKTAGKMEKFYIGEAKRQFKRLRK